MTAITHHSVTVFTHDDDVVAAPAVYHYTCGLSRLLLACDGFFVCYQVLEYLLPFQE